MTTKRDRREALENIRKLIASVEMKKNNKKTAAEMFKDHIEAAPEYKAVELAKIALDEAKERMFNAFATDEEYIQLHDGLDEAKYDLAMEQEVLAAEVLAYRDEFESRTVEIDEETERPIILKATLGKKQDIQLALDLDGKRQESLDV